MQTNDLLQLKEEIQIAKEQQQKLKGKKESLLEQLVELGCTDIKTADRKINQLDLEIKEASKEIELAMQEIENELT